MALLDMWILQGLAPPTALQEAAPLPQVMKQGLCPSLSPLSGPTDTESGAQDQGQYGQQHQVSGEQ